MRISPLRLGHLLRKEFRQLFRDPRAKRMVFGPPLIQLLLFGYAATTDVRNVRTFVVDHDGSAESRALVDALTAGDYFRVVGRSGRPADLTRALDAGDALVGLEIPAGFARDVRSGGGADVQVVVDGSNSNTATVAQGYAGRIVREFGARAAGDRGALPAAGVDLRARAWYNPELASRAYNVPAVIALILLLMGLSLTALAVVREREIGTLEQLLVTPATPEELMLGKTIPPAIVAFGDLFLVTAVAMLWFDIPLRGSFLLLAAASGLFILVAVALGLLISTVSRTQQEAFMAMFLFFLPAVILSGFMYPVYTMPEIFQHLTLLNPVRHFLEIVRGIFLKGEGLRELWLQHLVLLATAVAALRLAVWRFRATIA